MRLFKECAEEAHRPELHREAQPHVVPALGADQLAVGVVQVEVPRELVRGRLARVAAVLPLCSAVRNETDTRGPDQRASSLLARGFGRPSPSM